MQLLIFYKLTIFVRNIKSAITPFTDKIAINKIWNINTSFFTIYLSLQPLYVYSIFNYYAFIKSDLKFII